MITWLTDIVYKVNEVCVCVFVVFEEVWYFAPPVQFEDEAATDDDVII